MPLPDASQLLDDIGHAPGQSMTLRQLAALYGLSRGGRVALRRLLRRLAQEKQLVELRGRQRYGVPRTRETVTALLSGTARGFAFASPDDPDMPDVLIPQRHLHGALDGDRVEVTHLRGTDRDRPAGEVVRITERGRHHLVGLFVARRGREAAKVLPVDPRVGVEVTVPDRFTHDAEDGDYVEVSLLRDSREGRLEDRALLARVTAVLGRIEEAGTDVRVIARSYGLDDAHPPEVVAEAERRSATGVTTAEIERRADLRGLRTVTIDGETARDFDDAVSVEREGECYRLHVHVADVSHFVQEGTALDEEAYARATSVYFPDRAIHMLPESLSAGACSLRPEEDRLAMSVAMKVDSDGEIGDVEIREAVIRSDRRMTYTEIKGLLVDRDETLRERHRDLLPDFELMAEVAERLIAARERRGGLDFDLPVPMLRVDENGLVTDIVHAERNVAHRIIEEFMIAANRAVARELDRTREPAVYRNHDPPPPDKIEAFREAAAVFGHELKGSGEPSPADFQRVLEAAEGRPEEQLLTSLALRSMSLAVYSAELRGHFGLALGHYTHFTSPIRRYPDLLVHRALKRLLRGERVPEEDRDEATAELAEDAEHCSRRERNAEDAERALVKWKACVFMREREGETYDARVVAFVDHGVVVLLERHPVEGSVHYRDLRSDYWEKDETGLRIVGRDSGRVIRLGDQLRVRVQEVDLVTRRIHLAEHA